MCARFTVKDVAPLLKARFGIDIAPLPIGDKGYNLAPTDAAPTILDAADDHFSMLEWGFGLPTETGAYKPVVNARMETADSKPLFRESFHEQHCLVPAGGYFEWEKQASARLPWRITRSDGQPFAFAGLWRKEKRRKSTMVFTILTAPAHPDLAWLHDRMPIILPPNYERDWLAGDNPKEMLESAVADFQVKAYTWFRVDPRVNSSRAEGPELIKPGQQQGSLF
ncbi:MAG: SOS response-associated peptidase [Bacteroidota bacterium]